MMYELHTTDLLGNPLSHPRSNLGNALVSLHIDMDTVRKGVLTVRLALRAAFRLLDSMVLQGSWRAPEESLCGKHAVVTGPTIGGIGYETALGLASRGATVTLACRNEARGHAAVRAIEAACPLAPKPRVLVCDVSDLHSVRSFADDLKRTTPAPVDILVANAGAVVDGKRRESAQGSELTFATCALGHHLLAHLLAPARMVWVTGELYAALAPLPPRFTCPGPRCSAAEILAYMNACLGRLMMARAHALRDPEAEVLAVHPGVIASNFGNQGRMSSAMRWFMSRLFIDPTQGAQASIYAASCDWREVPSGTLRYFHNKNRWLTLSADDPAMDNAACEALWRECDALCSIKR
mmetsp:Transcript_13790/g.24428  ORF Transcript_13790/g.24428 Transcript_13790/m.24428 type:complete len:352 (-) Transcript_13790:1591-2646(-)